MKVYFLSEKPSALTLNGIYLGMIDGFERSVELNPDDNIRAEIAPDGCVPLRFTIDQDFLFSPPPRIQLYYTDCAVAIFAFGFLREDQSLSVRQETRIGSARFTIYRQGEVYLRYDNGKQHVIPLDDRFEKCEKDSREQFEQRTHKRLIDIITPTPKTVDALQRLEMPAGVYIDIKMKNK